MAESKVLASRAKQYSNLKYSLSILDTVYSIVLILAFLGTGMSKALALSIQNFNPNRFLAVPLYLLIVFIAYYILSLPLNLYRSYSVEHKFSLSNQSLGNWFADQFKSEVISYIMALIFAGAFFYSLKQNALYWWIIISLFWIFFSLIMAKLTPVVIIPLFFKYKKLSDEALRQRILKLAEKMRVKILDCFEIDFSKKTLKANAAFVGWGLTRRVLLADTLKDKYNHDEIEAILAHEFSHYKLKHLFKILFVNSVATLVCFYLIFKTNAYLLKFFGLTLLSDIGVLPIIFLYFLLLGLVTQPFQNYLVRRMEKNADNMALKVTGLAQAFISMMEKLASQNLADRNPHPLIKFFFYDHPPVDERIAMAKSFEVK